MPNRNILVIGGNGFIGRNLCQTLLEHGEKVHKSYQILAHYRCNRADVPRALPDEPQQAVGPGSDAG